MIDQFQELLKALGQHLGVTLQPDKRGACRLNVQDVAHIQLEYEPAKEQLLIISFVCEVPPGKLRENIFRDALKANHPYSLDGVFGYSERNNQLCLFLYKSIHGLTAEKLSGVLNGFMEKVNKWKDAVGVGQTATLVPMASGKEKPFGL